MKLWKETKSGLTYKFVEADGQRWAKIEILDLDAALTPPFTTHSVCPHVDQPILLKCRAAIQHGTRIITPWLKDRL